ncbi:hypothetical protein V8J88_03800 [Massilia sp. W12]|uniref:hypothetical protein n=1 Tax=Massilia sp. W12 TaxID=3126507 RepID=UPI0030D55C95
MTIESAAGAAGLKALGAATCAAGLATAAGFALMWPKTPREAFARFALAFTTSITVGSGAVLWLYDARPGAFASARAVAGLFGAAPEYGYLVLAGIVMAASALPAWWIGGAVSRWFERRKDQDVAEMLHDAAATVNDVRKTI